MLNCCLRKPEITDTALIAIGLTFGLPIGAQIFVLLISPALKECAEDEAIKEKQDQQ